jgi:hypothetical protein
MAGEIQIGGTTFATESGGTVTVSNVDSAINRQNLGLQIGVDVQQYDADTTKNDVANTFTANQIISVTDNLNAALRVTQLGTGNAIVVEDSTNPDSTPFVVDSTGKLLVGTPTSVTSSVSQQSLFQVYSTSSSSSSIQIGNYTNGVNAAGLHFDKSRGSLGTNTVLQSGDYIGSIKFNGADGTNLVRAATIDCTVNGTPGTNDMPGRLVFSTTADGASSPTERMSIDSSGALILTGSTAQKATGTTWSNPSDQRLKSNISDYPKGTAELMQVRVREWEYNGKGGTVAGTKGLGVIADEIMTVLPNTVDNYEAKLNVDDEETTKIKKFDATEITWLLVKTTQEQQALIESQQSQIDALTARIEALETV